MKPQVIDRLIYKSFSFVWKYLQKYLILLMFSLRVGKYRIGRKSWKSPSPNTYFEYFDKTVAIHCPQYLHTKLDNKIFEIWIDWDKYELHFTFSLSLASEILYWELECYNLMMMIWLQSSCWIFDVEWGLLNFIMQGSGTEKEFTV